MTLTPEHIATASALLPGWQIEWRDGAGLYFVDDYNHEYHCWEDQEGVSGIPRITDAVERALLATDEVEFLSIKFCDGAVIVDLRGSWEGDDYCYQRETKLEALLSGATALSAHEGVSGG